MTKSLVHSLKRPALLMIVAAAWFSMLAADLRAGDSTRTFYGGITLRKMAGFYWLNGFSAEYRPKQFLHGHFRTGLNLTSSMFGSALVSRAIPVYCYELYAQFQLRRKALISPFVTLSAGYAHAVYGGEFAGSLQRWQSLVAPEVGMSVKPFNRIDFHLSAGYNIISGNGVSGMGVIYPVFFQLRALMHVR